LDLLLLTIGCNFVHPMKGFSMYVIYIFVKSIVWWLSLLPFRLLYCISDILSFLLYYVFRYRKNVVIANLTKSFPEKSPAKIREIAHKFYSNLSDIIVETIKQRRIGEKSLEKRIRITNYEILDKYYKNSQNIIAVMGHCSNWELSIMYLGLKVPRKAFVIVKPLSNKYFDSYFGSIRLRLVKAGIIKFKDSYRTLLKHRDKPFICVFVADQTPTRGEINYWTTFLHQDTPVFLGAEKIARSLNCAVIFIEVNRPKRGFYELTIHEIEQNPRETKPYEITEKHVQLLEKIIQNHPENWLWSHKRWKHKKDDNTILLSQQ